MCSRIFHSYTQSRWTVQHGDMWITRRFFKVSPAQGVFLGIVTCPSTSTGGDHDQWWGKNAVWAGIILSYPQSEAHGAPKIDKGVIAWSAPHLSSLLFFQNHSLWITSLDSCWSGKIPGYAQCEKSWKNPIISTCCRKPAKCRKMAKNAAANPILFIHRPISCAQCTPRRTGKMRKNRPVAN